MLCYNRIDVSEDNDVNKTRASIVYRKILLGNLKLLMIYFIIDKILHYPKKTVHRLFTITTNIHGDVLWETFFETLNKILKNI